MIVYFIICDIAAPGAVDEEQLTRRFIENQRLTERLVADANLPKKCFIGSFLMQKVLAIFFKLEV